MKVLVFVYFLVFVSHRLSSCVTNSLVTICAVTRNKIETLTKTDNTQSSHRYIGLVKVILYHAKSKYRLAKKKKKKKKWHRYVI